MADDTYAGTLHRKRKRTASADLLAAAREVVSRWTTGQYALSGSETLDDLTLAYAQFMRIASLETVPLRERPSATDDCPCYHWDWKPADGDFRAGHHPKCPTL